MFIKTLLAAGLALGLSALVATPSLSADNSTGIEITDAYFRAPGKMAKAGAAFMRIVNRSGQADRLIGARSDMAKMVQTHTHVAADDGVVKMRHVPEGFEIPAGGERLLARGGDHLMFMGLTRPVIDGQKVTVTLLFERAGEVTVEMPIDLKHVP